MEKANYNETLTTSQSLIKAEIRELFKETIKRYPGQTIPKDAQQAWMVDWMILAKRIGFSRFSEGVKRSWAYCQFFPHISNIEELAPSAPMKDGERWLLEMKDLIARKNAGEKFYTLGDVFAEVARKIKAGEIKPKDPSWIEWAKGIKSRTS